MHISTSFIEDIEKTYVGLLTTDQLIQRQKLFLLHMSHHAYNFLHYKRIPVKRYVTVDDYYQEACIILVESLWNWNEDSGISLSRYAVYNIGAKLQNLNKKFLCKKRNAITTNIYADDEEYSILPYTLPTQEDFVLIQEINQLAQNEISEKAIALLNELMNSNGKLNPIISQIQEKNQTFFQVRYEAQSKLIPQILNFLHKHHIIEIEKG